MDPPPATSVYATSASGSGGGRAASGFGSSGSPSGGEWEVGSVRSQAVQLLGAGSTIVVDGKPFTATIGEDGEPLAPPQAPWGAASQQPARTEAWA